VLPDADHVVVPSGHVPQFERPAQTHAAVLAFLRRHPLRRASAA
jgi:pimeloyl-ACP methyl ester carboxylesterase